MEIKLTKAQCEIIEQVCGEREIQIHTNYSGRGMFGDKCFGISGNQRSLNIYSYFIRSLIDRDRDLAEEFLTQAIREDSMGRGSIIYWEGIQWNEEYELYDEDDE